jgi:hypothetical protein
MKESDIALKFCQFFTDKGYEIYKEVQYCGGRIDIVATDGHLRIACEVKTTASLQVLGQAVHAHNWCHYSYIGIPSVSNHFYAQICDKYGIGILTQTRWGEVWEHTRPTMRRRVSPLKLHDYQKESVAGGVAGTQMTGFKKTVRDIVAYVMKNPDAKFSDVLKNIDTHYHSISTAKSSIRQWVNKGVIKEFTIEKGVVVLTPPKFSDFLKDPSRDIPS